MTVHKNTTKIMFIYSMCFYVVNRKTLLPMVVTSECLDKNLSTHMRTWCLVRFGVLRTPVEVWL